MRAQASSSGSRYSYDEVVARRPAPPTEPERPVAEARVFADEGSASAPTW